MIQTTAASLFRRIAASLSILAFAFALSASSAAAAEGAVHYTKESLQSYEHQLAAGQIQSATFNKRIRSLHLTLKDGTLVLVHYGPKEEPKLAAALTAKGVPVTVEQKSVAAKEAGPAKPVHHKLRYIVGGILIVVVIVIGAVLLVDRRRKQAAE